MYTRTLQTISPWDFLPMRLHRYLRKLSWWTYGDTRHTLIYKHDFKRFLDHSIDNSGIWVVHKQELLEIKEALEMIHDHICFDLEDQGPFHKSKADKQAFLFNWKKYKTPSVTFKYMMNRTIVKYGFVWWTE